MERTEGRVMSPDKHLILRGMHLYQCYLRAQRLKSVHLHLLMIPSRCSLDPQNYYGWFKFISSWNFSFLLVQPPTLVNNFHHSWWNLWQNLENFSINNRFHHCHGVFKPTRWNFLVTDCYVDSPGRGMRPLAYAACYGHASVVELLLTEGASVDATDESGGRPQLRKLKL